MMQNPPEKEHDNSLPAEEIKGVLKKLIELHHRYMENRFGELNYQEIAGDLLTLSGARYALINIHDCEGKTTVVKAVAGVVVDIAKADKLLRFPLAEKTWVVNQDRLAMTEECKIECYSSLQDLSQGAFSKATADSLLEAFSIGNSYAVKMNHNGKPLGDLIMLMEKGETLKQPEVIELYARQLSLMLVCSNTEKALSKNNELLKQITGNITDIVCVTDVKGSITYMSPAIEGISGFTAEELTGKNILDLVHEQDLPRILAAVEAARAGKTQGMIDYRLNRKTGDHVWVESRGIYLEENGERTGVTFVTRDISRQKAIEERLIQAHSELEIRIKERTGELQEANIALEKEIYSRQTAEDSLKRLLQSEKMIAKISAMFVSLTPENFDEVIYSALKLSGELHDVDRSYLFLFSPDGKYLDNTHEWCAEGIEPQKERSQHAPIEGIPWLMKKLLELKPVNIPLTEELPPEAKAEKNIFNKQAIKSLLLVPIIEQNNLLGFIGYDSVRFSKVWAEDHLRLLTVVANIITAAISKTRAETQLALASKLKSIGQLAAGLAHEINNPMQYIGDNVSYIERAVEKLMAYINSCCRLQAIKNDSTTDKVEVCALSLQLKELSEDSIMRELPLAVQQSLEGIGKVNELLTGMQSYSHYSQSDMTLADINETLKNTLIITRNKCKFAAEVETDLDPDLPLVECNISEINQVFLNIIINAIYAIKEAKVTKDKESSESERGKITVKTWSADENVFIEFEDDGTGIPKTNLCRLFDPFFTTKPPGQGTGQGLTIAHNIISKHGGTIEVQSESGKGAQFRIILPLSHTKQSVIRADDEA